MTKSSKCELCKTTLIVYLVLNVMLFMVGFGNGSSLYIGEQLKCKNITVMSAVIPGHFLGCLASTPVGKLERYDH